MKIRFATQEDAPSIASIHLKAWRKAYSGIIPGDYLDDLSLDKRRKMWEKNLQASEQTVMVVTGSKDRVAGWVSLGDTRDREAAHGTGEVYGLYIDPSSWGKGMGKALLAAAEERLKYCGYTFSTLWVLKDNTSARDFYEDSGYEADLASKRVLIAGKELQELRYCKDLSSSDFSHGRQTGKIP